MLKKFASRLRQMSRPAYILLRTGILLALVMLSASLLFIVAFGDSGLYAFREIKQAYSLYDAAAGVLMLSVILSAVLEYKMT